MFLFSTNTFIKKNEKKQQQHKQNHLNLKIHEVSLSPFAAAQFIPPHLARLSILNLSQSIGNGHSNLAKPQAFTACQYLHHFALWPMPALSF